VQDITSPVKLTEEHIPLPKLTVIVPSNPVPVISRLFATDVIVGVCDAKYLKLQISVSAHTNSSSPQVKVSSLLPSLLE